LAAGDAANVPAPPQAMSEIRALFADYLKAHAANDMEKFKEFFLPEANCVSTAPDGAVRVQTIAQLAGRIAEEAKSIKSQHETFNDTRIEVYGNTALYVTNWTLFHDGKPVRHGRAFFSLVRKEGAWRVAALVWHRD
jgi:ketosteroid isomerase-like protein